MRTERSRKRYGAPKACTPCVETLEPRLLLACQAFLEEGVLTIRGDEADDLLKIVDDGYGNIQLQCTERLNDPPADDGTVETADPQLFEGVALIVANTDGGDDRIQYQLASLPRLDVLSQDVQTGQQPVDLRIATGIGADSLTIVCDAVMGPQGSADLGPWNIEFFGGDGPDTGRMEFGSLSNLEGLTVFADLGEGVDRLKGILGNMAVPTAMTVVAGPGDDLVRFRPLEGDQVIDSFFDISFDIDLGPGDNVLALDGKGNDIAVKAQAGAGADKVIVRVKPVPASPANMEPGTLTAQINLGGGNDVARIKTLDGDSAVDSFFDVFCDVNLGNGKNLAAIQGKFFNVVANVQGGTGVDRVLFKSIPVSLAGMEPGNLTAQINLGGGDDIARIEALDGDSAVDSFFDVFCDVNLGNGKNLAAIQGKFFNVVANIQGGTGPDKAIVRVKPVPASAANMEPGALTAQLKLGGGNDVARIETLNDDFNVNSFFDVFCELDLGNGDNLAALDGKGNDVVANIRGGRGVDRVLMHMLATGAVNSTVRTGVGNDLVEGNLILTPSRVDVRSANEDVLSSTVQVYAGLGDDRVTMRITAPREASSRSAVPCSSRHS